MEILDCACILISVLHFLVKNVSDYCVPISFEGVIDLSAGDKGSQKVLEKLLEIFSIKDQEYFMNSQGHCIEFLRRFLEQELNLSTKASIKNPFEPSSILQTFLKIDSHYQRSLGIEDLDERFFIKEKNVAMTPSKFTPFCRQGAANKTQSVATSFSSLAQNGLVSARDSQSGQLIPAAPVKLHQDQKPEGAERQFTSQRMLNYDVTETISIKSNISEIVS